MSYQPRGLYFEDFAVGATFTSRARTVTEADIVAFAGLSGDFNPIHTDAVYAAQDTFGRRVAHGLLVQSIASGLVVQTGLIDGTTLAFRQLTVKFSEVVFIGDTIHVEMEITNKKAFRRIGGGNIFIKMNVVNQAGEIVQKGEWVMLVKMKPAAEGE